MLLVIADLSKDSFQNQVGTFFCRFPHFIKHKDMFPVLIV